MINIDEMREEAAASANNTEYHDMAIYEIIFDKE